MRNGGESRLKYVVPRYIATTQRKENGVLKNKGRYSEHFLLSCEEFEGLREKM